ncbi:MAG: hypothetical protein M1817_002950 [Caeruleum heppii]|nr:MAG: hypothetical protein M1817_002950 [Caeruleum heppii]
MADQMPPLKWSSQLSVAPSTDRSIRLPGDKILLPPSALEQLLAAAPAITTSPEISGPSTSTFDPFNPYSYAAETQARSAYRDTQQQLPHPLTFRLVNPENGRVVYAGIREFSAEEGEVALSSFLRSALGLLGQSAKTHGVEETVPGVETGTIGVSLSDGPSSDAHQPRITVHARQLPKGTYVRLRPLEAGYDPEDWKSLLEQHLRKNFTTLTNGEILTVPGGRGLGGKDEAFQFLIDKVLPEEDAICIIDTDLEVDIEALNEAQARETLNRRLARTQKIAGDGLESSSGGELKSDVSEMGQVREDAYVDYQLSTWDRKRGLEIEIEPLEDDAELDLYVSPLAARQRARPRHDEFVFGDCSSRYPKRIKIQASNVELQDAEALWISVHGYPTSGDESRSVKGFRIRASAVDSIDADDLTQDDEAHDSDEVRCRNCHQWVPQRTMMLHENFCLRNNILCPHCSTVFKKSSSEWTDHWHCPHDTYFGNTLVSKRKHDTIFHRPEEFSCPNCDFLTPSLPSLAHHRTTVCPGKIILCQFCHLLVPQEGDPSSPNPEALLSNLTAHELADGARTTECHLCSKIVRLRDMKTHLRHHDLERKTRVQPGLCRNSNCGRTLDGAGKQSSEYNLGLCGICYGPLYVSMYDPEGKALRRRVERRYLSQMLAGCGKIWCRNRYCKTGRSHIEHPQGGEEDPKKSMTTKDALPTVTPLVDAMLLDTKGPIHFCTDEASQTRRALAELMAAKTSEGSDGYELGWCVKALEKEANDVERARGWLRDWAPRKGER